MGVHAVPAGAGQEGRGFWYPRDPESADPPRTPAPVEVLDALRLYRAAERAMSRRTRRSMGMGESDLLAVRYLLEAQQAGGTVTAKDLARRLGISSASTTVLVDRLVRSGHARREAHPTDRRAVVVIATPESARDVRAALGDVHREMLDVAETLGPEELRAVLAFLDAMRRVMDRTASSVPPGETATR
jgi:DNA-binding MarR family transcriptional regulator